MHQRIFTSACGLVLCHALALPAQEAKRDDKARQPRVLLLAGGPCRDFQMVRHIFARAHLEKRLDLTVSMQSTPSIEGEPYAPSSWKFHEVDAKGKLTLSNYDVIVAFDADWPRLGATATEELRRWVEKQGGGLIVVPGPIHAPYVSRIQAGVKPLQDIMPVRVKRASEIALVSKSARFDTGRPYFLTFPGAVADMEFLRLDSKNKNLLADWKEFFWKGKEPAKLQDAVPVRGFFDCLPHAGIHAQAQVVAAFVGPAQREEPFLVTLRAEAGIVIHLNEGFWRLRNYREACHERFWAELIRYAAASGKPQRSTSGLSVGTQYAVGRVVHVEACLVDNKGKALPQGTKAEARVAPPLAAKTEMPPLAMQPLPGATWTGWFRGSFTPKAVGKYHVEVKYPGQLEPLTAAIEVAPNADAEEMIGVVHLLREWEVRVVQAFGERERAEAPAVRAEAAVMRKLLDTSRELKVEILLEQHETFMKTAGKAKFNALKDAAARGDKLCGHLKALRELLAPKAEWALSQDVVADLAETGSAEAALAARTGELAEALLDLHGKFKDWPARAKKGLDKREFIDLKRLNLATDEQTRRLSAEIQKEFDACQSALRTLKKHKFKVRTDDLQSLDELVAVDLASLAKLRVELGKALDKEQAPVELVSKLSELLQALPRRLNSEAEKLRRRSRAC